MPEPTLYGNDGGRANFFFGDRLAMQSANNRSSLDDTHPLMRARVDMVEGSDDSYSEDSDSSTHVMRPSILENIDAISREDRQ